MSFKIPGKLKQPVQRINNTRIWLYGEPKIGKTTFASKFPGVWFIATEPGQQFVQCRAPTPIKDWQSFMAFAGFLLKETPRKFADDEPIKWLCVDTVDKLYRMCYEYTARQLGVEDPSELTHGKGWARLRNNWFGVMIKVAQLPYGIIFISHAREKILKQGGLEVTRAEPEIGKAAFDFLRGACDYIWFCTTKQSAQVDEKGDVTGKVVTERIIQCQPSRAAMAGGRYVRKMPAQMRLNYDDVLSFFDEDQEDQEDQEKQEEQEEQENT